MAKKGLKDTFSARRGLVNTFKPVFIPGQGRLDFRHWLALPGKGYCFQQHPGAAMAMDFISSGGTITGVVVGPVPGCAGARPDLALEARFRKEKHQNKNGGGC